MCTVSYIPSSYTSGGFILTSNRDEKVHRPTTVPQVYHFGSVQLCFPKDAKAGGSWIAANNEGRVACLLNGGLLPHEKKPFQTHSRGRVLVDLVASQQEPMIFFSYNDLSRTEPFTVVTIDQKENEIVYFSEFIWDGTKKFLKELDPGEPHFWSSVTLYSASERNIRKRWFDQFLMEPGKSITPEKVLDFHSGRHTRNERINMVMRREDALETVSITQVKPGKGTLCMKYTDLVDHTSHMQQI